MDEQLSLKDLRTALEAVAVPADAEPMKAYMKGHFEFLGVKAPARRTAQKATIAAGRGASAEDLLVFAQECFAQPEREFHHVACDLLRRWVKTLGPEHLPEIEGIIATNSWWDTVDVLAVHVVGPLVKANPELKPVMDQFVEDPDFWIARTAIIHQLMFKADTDAEQLFRYAALRASDTEFFIRKAIGWSLRQYSRIDGEAVQAFVAAHEGQLSGLSKREALRLLK